MGTEPSNEAVEARVNLLETALAIAREHVRLYGGEGKHLELVSLLKQAVDGPHLEPQHVRALLAFGDTAFGPAELDDDHDEALALLRGGALDLKHDLSAIRNRWEQEVRERLLELADKFEAEAGPNGPKQCQCCRKANKQLLDLAAAFGEAD